MNAIFRGKAYGAATVGERGQIVIPADLRKALRIRSGDKIMIFAKLDKKVINLMREEDFSAFLRRAARFITRLEREVPHR